MELHRELVAPETRGFFRFDEKAAAGRLGHDPDLLDEGLRFFLRLSPDGDLGGNPYLADVGTFQGDSPHVRIDIQDRSVSGERGQVLASAGLGPILVADIDTASDEEGGQYERADETDSGHAILLHLRSP